MTDSDGYDRGVIGTGQTIANMQAWKFCHGIRRAQLLKPSRRMNDAFCPVLRRRKRELRVFIKRIYKKNGTQLRRAGFAPETTLVNIN